jgi:hypothetical protein
MSFLGILGQYEKKGGIAERGVLTIKAKAEV